MTHAGKGWLNGMIGILIFSGSLPATRLAVASFQPVFLTAARAVIAGVLGLILLLAFHEQRPNRGDLPALVMVAIGVVVGFPLLTAGALTYITSAQSQVFVGLLPLSTAIFGFIRGGERPRRVYWIFAIGGGTLVSIYALSRAGEQSVAGNLLMITAIVVCGLGYAEGAKLARRLGGWQVISWALVLSLPLMSIVTALSLPATFAQIRPAAWWGLAYVSLFSMLIGFIFWYRGLAEGGISGVSQLQLLQPFFGLAIAALLLREDVEWHMILVALGAVLCVIGARKFSVPQAGMRQRSSGTLP